MRNAVQNQMRKDRLSTTALNVPRTMRGHRNTFMLNMKPGKMMPVAAGCLHREDAVRQGAIQIGIQMDETAEALLNPVVAKMSLYLVPWLAMPRFLHREHFEASYDQRVLEGETEVFPFVETEPRGAEGDNEILDALGRHGAPTREMATWYTEAYNVIANHRFTQASKSLDHRTRLQKDIAPAIRILGTQENIVPDFDQAAMDGAVSIQVNESGELPVKGLGVHNGYQTDIPATVFEGGQAVAYPYAKQIADPANNATYLEQDASGATRLRVEFDDLEMRFSLAEIEQARKLQAFAELRKRYNGHDDNAIISKLMNGIRIPDKMLEQPILLGETMSGFGFQTRYATDSENLEKHVVQGATFLSMQFATPQINTGGVIMAVVEIQPEQVFERQEDPFLAETNVDRYPQFLRDELDEQKVDRVFNRMIDTAHNDPDGVFGYEPMNARWMINSPCIGTGLFQPEPAVAFDEARARIWDTAPVNPQLGPDFYLTNDMNLDVFEYTEGDPFEVQGEFVMAIGGLTQFGNMLVEGEGDYDAIVAEAPTQWEQINQTDDV